MPRKSPAINAPVTLSLDSDSRLKCPVYDLGESDKGDAQAQQRVLCYPNVCLPDSTLRHTPRSQ